jgi:hypothetical protein
MAYYTALINAWNSATQPPTGVTGTGLLGGDTTAQKLAKVQAWTVTGTAPSTFYITGVQIANCINWVEFAALTAAQQLNLLTLLNQPGGMIGGSAQTAQLAAGMILAYFTNHAGPTVTALTALAQGIVQPFWSYAGLNGPISQTDVTLAGLS